jgi:hypothetical protein
VKYPVIVLYRLANLLEESVIVSVRLTIPSLNPVLVLMAVKAIVNEDVIDLIDE